MSKSLIDRSEFERPINSLNFPKPLMLSDDVTLLDVVDFLQENKIGSCLLHNNDKLSGIITERDFSLRIIGVVEDWKTQPASLFMTKNPTSVNETAQVIDVIELMTREEYRHLPVTNDAGSVVAIVSVKDLLSIMVDIFRDDIESVGTLVDWDYINTVNYSENFSSLSEIEGQISSSIFFAELRRVIYKPAITIDHNATVQDTLKLMQERKTGSVLVMEYETKIVGVVTERDMLLKFLGKHLFSDDLNVKEIMTPNPHLLLHRHNLAHAVNNMFKFKYRSTIVVNEDKYPLSIVGLLEVFKFISLHLFKQ